MPYRSLLPDFAWKKSPEFILGQKKLGKNSDSTRIQLRVEKIGKPGKKVNKNGLVSRFYRQTGSFF